MKKVTPMFQESKWEVLSKHDSAGFVELSCDVIRRDRATDELFEEWGGTESECSAEKAETTASVASKPFVGLEDEYNNKLELVRKEGYDAGYAAGVAAARKDVGDDYGEKFGAIEGEMRGAIEQLRQAVEDSEREAVKLALDVARKIVETAVEVKPEYIVSMVRTGLKTLGVSKPMRVRLSEQDYEFLQVVGFPPDLSEEELGIKYVIDESIKGGCVIETDFGEVDMKVDEMWEQIKGSIFSSSD